MKQAVFLVRGRCPNCGEASELAPSNPSRPFCSERCKQVDFEGWVNGRFALPVVEQDGGDEPAEGDAKN